MNKIAAIILILYLSLGYSPARFIPLRPSDVPFAYDPNEVNYDIIEARREYPFTNKDITFRRVAYDPDGDICKLTCSAGYVTIAGPAVSIDPNDPNGTCTKNEFICTISNPLNPGLYIIDWELTDNDPNEPGYDRATTLLYIWPKNRPPIINK